jgi:hypothetical protein
MTAPFSSPKHWRLVFAFRALQLILKKTYRLLTFLAADTIVKSFVF